MKVSHVIVIGVDGAGSFFRQAETPNLDRIFARGAKTEADMRILMRLARQAGWAAGREPRT